MTYEKIFEQDTDYQNFTGEFLRKKARFEQMADQGIYKKDNLLEVSNKLYNELKDKVEEHYTTNLEAIKKDLEHFENKTKKIGYAEREAEAKEFEMRYKLADDYELKNMAQDLQSNDLLEINLLRMELKNRKMEEEDRAVKHYIIQNNLNGLDDIDQKEYDNLRYKLGVFSTMGSGRVFLNGGLQSLENIKTEMDKTAKKVVPDKTIKRDVILEQFSL